VLFLQGIFLERVKSFAYPFPLNKKILMVTMQGETEAPKEKPTLAASLQSNGQNNYKMHRSDISKNSRSCIPVVPNFPSASGKKDQRGDPHVPPLVNSGD
jgi:hypothetical protein